MNKFISHLEQKIIFDNRLIFVRSLLAFGALLTICFNDIDEVTNMNLLIHNETSFKLDVFLQHISLFNLFSSSFAKTISISILLIVFTGYFPQLFSLLQTWVHVSICNSLIAIEGGDQIASNLSMLLIPICIFDNRINQWSNNKLIITKSRKAINVFFNTYYFLILLQVAIIYLHAGVGKIFNDEWKDGTCIYYWFTNNIFGAPLWLQKILSIITLSPFTPLISWSVIILELGLFACILATDKLIKKLFLTLGVFFHLSIVLTHGLITFFFPMTAALILYLDNENSIYQYFEMKIKAINYGKKQETK